MANLTNNFTLSWPTTKVTTTLSGSTLSIGVSHREFVNSRNGGSNVRWKEKIRRGENATTDFDGTLQTITDDKSGSFMLRDTWSTTGQLMQQIVASGQPPTPETGGTQTSAPTADNLALRLILKAIRDQRSSFQGGVFLGELRETLTMLASPAKALRNGLNSYLSTAVKRARKGKLKTKQRILAETWLEYSFGWSPLLNDIKEASQAYLKHTERILTNRLTRVGKENSHTKLQTNAPGSNFHQVPIRITRESMTETMVIYRCGLRIAGQGASPEISVLERAGLTFRDFIPTVWELIPGSFLVDYFTNIGEMINAGATFTGDVIWVNKTIRSTNVFRRICVPDESASFDDGVTRRVISGTPSTYETRHKTVIRRVPLLTYPSFQVGIPGKPVQWMNLAALTVGARKASASLNPRF